MLLNDPKIGFLLVQVLVADSDVAFLHSILLTLRQSDQLLRYVSLELQL